MPRFEVLPLNEAKLKSATGKRAQIAREYLGYIQKLGPGQAGRLQGSEGESVGALRRRLGAAAKQAAVELEMKRVGDELFFWVREPGGAPRRRRGRPPKDARRST